MWVDAICINQADTSERNQQVALMSFIFSRAVRVLAWLGPKKYPKGADASRYMAREWRAGRTGHFAMSLAASTGEFRTSPKPDMGTFARMAESIYWTRIWIVQELCLPRLLTFAYGSDIWTYEEFRRWDFLAVAERNALPQSVSKGYDAIRRLLDAREQRHMEMRPLESLVERFATSGCKDPRDRVYGLLGCAKDVRPITGAVHATVSGQQPVAAHAPPSGLQSPTEPRRGHDSFKVDYASSCYDVWARMVRFVFFHARAIEGRVLTRVIESEMGPDTNDQKSEIPMERRISIVRTAGIVQSALNQMVEKELAGSNHSVITGQYPPTITAVGYIAGEILRLGPCYENLMASFHADKDWTGCWADHYAEVVDLAKLGWTDEEYKTKIVGYQSEDLDRIRDIHDPNIRAWGATGKGSPLTAADAGRIAPGAEEIGGDGGSSSHSGPRICLGTGYLMGLVPPTTRLGDVVVRFWNCDAAVVMRPAYTTKLSAAGTPRTFFTLVGRADVAEVIDRNSTPGRDSHAENCIAGVVPPGLGETARYSGSVDIEFNLKTLQMITSYSSW